jgi:hypothetical protein
MALWLTQIAKGRLPPNCARRDGLSGFGKGGDLAGPFRE